MNQTKILKTIIYQLIGENPFLLATFECIKQRLEKLPLVDLSNMYGSSYWPPNKIIIGVPDIIGCYNLLQNIEFLQDEDFTFQIKTDYKNHMECVKRCSGIIVNMPMTQFECDEIEKLLKGSSFLKDETGLSIYDIATIYSLAYSLYHEFGHVLHNKYILESEPIKREKAADLFAFEAVKSMKNVENNTFLLLGTLTGIIFVLEKRTPQEEFDDKNHPHSIERLYSLLDFWGIPDNSKYWELAYNVVGGWCEKNDILISWEKDTYESYKDKFIDAYIHFRKIPQ